MPPLEADWMTSSVVNATAAAVAAAASGGGGYPNGPAWLWWLMAILPLDPKAQVIFQIYSLMNQRMVKISRLLK